MIVLIMTAAGQLSVGGIVVAQGDLLDGRAIAGPTGDPVVMLTLTPAAALRLSQTGTTPTLRLDGKPIVARLSGDVIEIDGQPGFDAAIALARAISGRDPLPDSLAD